MPVNDNQRRHDRISLSLSLEHQQAVTPGTTQQQRAGGSNASNAIHSTNQHSDAHPSLALARKQHQTYKSNMQTAATAATPTTAPTSTAQRSTYFPCLAQRQPTPNVPAYPPTLKTWLGKREQRNGRSFYPPPPPKKTPTATTTAKANLAHLPPPTVAPQCCQVRSTRLDKWNKRKVFSWPPHPHKHPATTTAKATLAHLSLPTVAPTRETHSRAFPRNRRCSAPGQELKIYARERGEHTHNTERFKR